MGKSTVQFSTNSTQFKFNKSIQDISNYESPGGHLRKPVRFEFATLSRFYLTNEARRTEAVIPTDANGRHPSPAGSTTKPAYRHYVTALHVTKEPSRNVPSLIFVGFGYIKVACDIPRNPTNIPWSPVIFRGTYVIFFGTRSAFRQTFYKNHVK